MNVYVESNFVLELALVQEQSASCMEILRLGESGRIRLIIPGYCLTEPLDTILRRHKDRKRLRLELDAELQQLARTIPYQERLRGFREARRRGVCAAAAIGRTHEAVLIRLPERLRPLMTGVADSMTRPV